MNNFNKLEAASEPSKEKLFTDRTADLQKTVELYNGNQITFDELNLAVENFNEMAYCDGLFKLRACSLGAKFIPEPTIYSLDEYNDYINDIGYKNDEDYYDDSNEYGEIKTPTFFMGKYRGVYCGINRETGELEIGHRMLNHEYHSSDPYAQEDSIEYAFAPLDSIQLFFPHEINLDPESEEEYSDAQLLSLHIDYFEQYVIKSLKKSCLWDDNDAAVDFELIKAFDNILLHRATVKTWHILTQNINEFAIWDNETVKNYFIEWLDNYLGTVGEAYTLTTNTAHYDDGYIHTAHDDDDTVEIRGEFIGYTTIPRISRSRSHTDGKPVQMPYKPDIARQYEVTDPKTDSHKIITVPVRDIVQEIAL